LFLVVGHGGSLAGGFDSADGADMSRFVHFDSVAVRPWFGPLVGWQHAFFRIVHLAGLVTWRTCCFRRSFAMRDGVGSAACNCRLGWQEPISVSMNGRRERFACRTYSVTVIDHRECVAEAWRVDQGGASNQPSRSSSSSRMRVARLARELLP